MLKNNRKVCQVRQFPLCPTQMVWGQMVVSPPCFIFSPDRFVLKKYAVTPTPRTLYNEESAKNLISHNFLSHLAKRVLPRVSTGPCKASVFRPRDLCSRWTEERIWACVWRVSGAHQCQLSCVGVFINPHKQGRAFSLRQLPARCMVWAFIFSAVKLP